MKTNPSSPQKKRGSSNPFRSAVDIGTTLMATKEDILRFQREVATHPENFLSPLNSSPLKKGRTLPENPSLPAERVATQNKALAAITEKIEEISQGAVSQADIQEAIELKCTTRTLSILYSSVYQWKDSQSKLEIFTQAGEPIEKEDGTPGTRGAGLCYGFLRQNGLHNKIDHAEMAIALRTEFENTFQKTKTALEAEGLDINETQLKRILAGELSRKSGGRIPNGYKIQTAQEAAQVYCQRIAPKKEDLLHLAHTVQLTAATHAFVEESIPKPLIQHLLDNPLRPVYERKPSGSLILDGNGKPIFNSILPEKWRKEEIFTKAETSFQNFAQKGDETTTRILGGLLDTLRLPRRVNIPLQVALESLKEIMPNLPDMITQASEAQKTLLAYQISKPAHSLAYKLGISMAAASQGLLDKEQTTLLEEIQSKIENFPNEPLDPNSYQAMLFPREMNAEEGLEEINTLFQASKQALEKTLQPTPEPGSLPEPALTE